MNTIDLQSHSTASDGKQTPEALVDLAIERGVSALALTDHDTLAGIQPAIDHAEGKGIEIVPGIELGCDASEIGFMKVDVLGLLIDHKYGVLVSLTKDIIRKRFDQKREIIAKLKGFGFDIDFDTIAKTVGSSFGRPHVARFLLEKYPEEFSSIQEVFDCYLGEGKPAYVEQERRIGMAEAIRVIKDAGGIPVLAHPGVYQREDSLEIIDAFVDAGGEGLETYYPYHVIVPDLGIDERGNLAMIEFYKKVAEGKGLLESGGNDHHGGHRDTLGLIRVPGIILKRMREKASKST